MSSEKKLWSEGEKVNLLIQVVGQLTERGGPVRYGDLNMPGRTEKGLRLMMDKIRTQAATYRKQSGNTNAVENTKSNRNRVPVTPNTGASSGRSTRKRTKHDYAEFDNSEDDEETPSKKRIRGSSSIKKEVVDSEADTVIGGTFTWSFIYFLPVSLFYT
ncbi:hypothetical protein F4819DRAFT_460302 [Hypoxylon fuscum]|nr:hypothetical protein F4819DRAFT_460302 [Hypoxylon fuscum]